MRDLTSKLDDFVEYAEATKKFSDAGFYKECIKEIETLRQQIEQNNKRIAETEDFALFAKFVAERELDSDFVNPSTKGAMLLLAKEAEAITKQSTASDYESPWLLLKQIEAVEKAQVWLQKNNGSREPHIDLLSRYIHGMQEQAEKLGQAE